MDDTASTAAATAAAFDQLELSARAAGRSMQAAFALATSEGARLDDVLQSVGRTLAQMALQAGGQAASGLLSGGLSAALTGLVSGAAPAASAEVASSLGSFTQSTATRPLSVTMNVTTPDADSFRRSEAQVSAALARAVARGGRAM